MNFRITRTNILEYTRSIIGAILLALIFRSILLEPYQIPSASMAPTLMIGDRLFVSKSSYGYSRYSFPIDFSFIKGRIIFSEPERGDVIVFKSPNVQQGDSKNYIKRLIGLPGDEIQVKRGTLYINGREVPKRKVARVQYRESSGIYDCYEETLPNGIKYRILDPVDNSHLRFPDDTPIYKVPQNHYFFMGDNRLRSIDSRYVDMGFIPVENLIGRADVIFWSRDFSLLRMITYLDFGRLFTKL